MLENTAADLDPKYVGRVYI